MSEMPKAVCNKRGLRQGFQAAGPDRLVGLKINKMGRNKQEKIHKKIGNYAA